MTDFTLADAAAFLWFALCWAGYTACADHSPWRRHSISVAMNRERRGWMDQMMARELRMVDMQIVGNLMRSLGFFASTTILLVAGLIAVLGATEQAVETLTELPFAVPTTEAVWHVKVLLLIVIFVYAFFKFAWAFRLTYRPSKKSIKRMVEKIHVLTERKGTWQDTTELVGNAGGESEVKLQIVTRYAVSDCL